MSARASYTPTAVNAANAVIDRLRPLAVTLANGRCFRALLENLRDRDRSTVAEPYVSAIYMVRAGILRAAIGTIMAALDKPGTDRASVGQIIRMLEGMDLSILSYRWPDVAFGAAKLQQAKSDWAALLASAEFQDCKDFRDGAVGHTLVLDLPTVPNEAYFRLHDEAEELTLHFYAICGYGKPEFVVHRDQATANAKIFWDTYWKGMGDLLPPHI